MPETAVLIMGLILERPFCLNCLATKSGLSAMAVEHGLVLLGTAIRLHRRDDLCRSCGETKDVVSVVRRSKKSRSANLR